MRSGSITVFNGSCAGLSCAGSIPFPVTPSIIAKPGFGTAWSPLAGLFGLEIAAFAVMSNHLHVILRIRPDVVALWSDQEVARRWLALFPRGR
jgi:hypothetical protein